MRKPLDIFKIEQDGTVLWKGTAENLEVAELSVATLAATNPAEYLIVDQQSGTKTVVKAGSTRKTSG